MNAKEKMQMETAERMRGYLTPKSQIFVNVRHVSASGMTRVISFYTPIIDKETGRVWMRRLDRDICDLLGYSYDKKREGVTVRGCGMDMAFAVIYNLCCHFWGRERLFGWDEMAQRKEWI